MKAMSLSIKQCAAVSATFGSIRTAEPKTLPVGRRSDPTKRKALSSRRMNGSNFGGVDALFSVDFSKVEQPESWFMTTSKLTAYATSLFLGIILYMVEVAVLFGETCHFKNKPLAGVFIPTSGLRCSWDSGLS